MDFKKKTVSEVLAAKPVRRKPSDKNLPQTFWEGWRTGHTEAVGRDCGPLKGIGVAKVKTMLVKLSDMESRPLSGFKLDSNFVQLFAQWIVMNWDELAHLIQSESGSKYFPEMPSLGIVVSRAPDFLAHFLKKDSKTGETVKNKKEGW